MQTSPLLQGAGDLPDRSSLAASVAGGCPMSVEWKKFEGQVVKNIFPLQKFLGSTDHSAVFLTQSTHVQPKKLAIKFINAGPKADYQDSLLQREWIALRRPH